MSEADFFSQLNLRVLVRKARLITLLVAGCSAVYLGMRFDVVTLPLSGCSPVTKFGPGSRLLVDRWAGGWRAGDLAFVEDARGAVHFGLLGASAVAGCWLLLSDSGDCPSVFPVNDLPIEEDRMLGRVVLGLGR